MTPIVSRINAIHLRQILSVALKAPSACQNNLRACLFLVREDKKFYLKIILFGVLVFVWMLRMRRPCLYVFHLGTVFAKALYVLWFCTSTDKRFDIN